MNQIVQKVILTSVETSVSWVAYAGGMAAIMKIAPGFLKDVNADDLKNQMINMIKILGTSIVIAIIASMIATAARNSVENRFFPKMEINDIS